MASSELVTTVKQVALSGEVGAACATERQRR
jgi:hypothetical protein